MRTDIFSQFADLPDRFREDFGVLWELPDDKRSALVARVSDIYRTKTVGEHKAALSRAVSDIGGDAAALLRAMKLLLFIYREWNPVRDTPEAFCQDLDELGFIPQEKAKPATSFLLDFLAEVQRDNLRRLSKLHATSLMPSLKGCTTLVDFRAVIRNPFGTGLDDKIEDYEPRCIAFVPVIIAKIKCDSGNPDNLIFQCEEEDVSLIIESLEAALRDLRAAKASFPGGDIK